MRSAFGAVLLGLLLAGCGGGGGGGGGTSCDEDSDCIGGVCVGGRCVSRVDAGPTCVDNDGDGYGVGCERGPDCDDGSPTQTGNEVCDMTDNDCDGAIDEGTISACGTCDPLCRSTRYGADGDVPFDLERDANEGVVLDEMGGLMLRRREAREPSHVIWIANTGEGTVSKVDTRTFDEVGRYRTGPLGAGNDPSRTSVDADGDVYVGNRSGFSLTKISSRGAECPDQDGDGVVETSTGPTDILDWGQDECVLWHTPLPGGGLIRAVAAQEGFGPDGELHPYVWVGGFDSSVVWKLDGATGDILFQTPAPVTPYGFALDGYGNLWMASLESRLGRIDTNRCVSVATCMELCGDTGDTCVKQAITTPTETYGITVDPMQRVWLGGGTVKRYDPTAPVGSRWTHGPSIFVHGIAADNRGNIWGAAMEQGMLRIDADDPRRWATVPVTVGQSPKGVAVDGDGKVWGINMTEQNATVVVPRTELDDFTVWTEVAPGLVAPYTYSDMTGQQLRNATNQLGRYAAIIDSCPATSSEHVEIQELRFDADVPSGTLLEFRLRTAATRDALGSAEWVSLGDIPPMTSPLDVGGALTAAGVTDAQFIEVQATLRSTRTFGTAFATPYLRSFELVYICPDTPI